MTDTGETVITIDEEPYHATVLQMTVAKRDIQIFSIHKMHPGTILDEVKQKESSLIKKPLQFTG